MTIEYLPLTRLVRSYRDGFAIDKIEEHFHCTIDSGLIRIKKFKDCFAIQIRGWCCGSFYEYWHSLEFANTLPLAIGIFLDVVDEQIMYVSSMRCV